jgi:transcriptional regulator with XRE-family HTH domain
MNIKKEELTLKVGSRIRELRMHNGLTIEQLATEAGIEAKQLQRIELGQINTSIFQIYRISSALGVYLKEIFNF